MSDFYFYLCSGKRVSVDRVTRSKAATAEMYRTGKGGPLPVRPHPAFADAIDRMSLTEFSRWSGHFTYRPAKR